MSFNIFSLRSCQCVAMLMLVCAAFILAFSDIAYASPGAHGPDGEHIDASNNVAVSLNQKFESFTETFEVLGELFDDKLVIYLHDFKSNVPVLDATIEIESGELSASAEYSKLLKAYALTNQEMLQLLSHEGEHEIVLTVMTDDNGDLLSANLTNPLSHASKSDHEENHHHHFRWWEVILSIVLFGLGFLLGRLRKEKKS